jgi:dTDP-4-dehydrorhamnose reductase
VTVLLLGASGLLGTHLSVRLPQSFDTCAPVSPHSTLERPAAIRWLRAPLDATAPAAALERVLDEARAEIVVNAVGLTPAAAATSAAGRLETINTQFPRALAEAAVARSVRVVHVSTDAVFSGARGGYTETDAPDPGDEYGRSKLAGELGSPHLTLRTSLFGRSARGVGLIEWLIARRGGAVDGYADYRFTGVAAVTLADLIATAIERGLSGTYHVGGEPMTKFSLLRAAADFLKLDADVRETFNGAVDRTLDSTRFYRAIDRAQPTLAQMIATLESCPVRTAA